MDDPAGSSDPFDDALHALGDFADALVDTYVEQRFGDADMAAETTDDGARASLRDGGTEYRDPTTGMNVTLGTEEALADFGVQGAHLKYQRDGVTWSSGSVWGDAVQVSAHGGEIWGEVQVGADGSQFGAHADIAGADVRIGSDQNNLKVGLSIGEGLAAGYQTGGDSDGDGYQEWSLSGEGGPLSVSFTVEPGYVADQAVDLANSGAEYAAADPLGAAGEVVELFAPDPLERAAAVAEGLATGYDAAAGVVDRGLTGWQGIGEQVYDDAADTYGAASDAVDGLLDDLGVGDIDVTE